jgi:FtsH-binding integral membrane protein
MKAGGSLSIWFFIGLSLLVNGVLICATGVYELAHPPENPVVLYSLHAPIWWGGVLLLLGLFFCLRFSPARERAANARGA